MNAAPASGNGRYSTTQEPFFYAQPTAQQMFPNQCFLGPVYNPYGIPTTGFRSGSPYYPLYSIPLHDYPGYLVPQHPMHMRVNRRPYFNGHLPSPMFYQATRFRHYSPGKRTETKETQTDPKQSEHKLKKHQDHSMETQGCDAGNTAYIPSTPAKGAETPVGKQERSVFSAVTDRDFAKNSSGPVQFRSLPPSSYAYEKEEVRIEYDNDGASAIQLWKSFKETIPLYDVAEKSVPENIIQRDVFALASSEAAIYGSRDRGELVPSLTYPEEQKAIADVLDEEPQHQGKRDAEKPGAAGHSARSPLDGTKAAQGTELTGPNLVEGKQETSVYKRSSGSKRSSSSKTPQEVPNPSPQSELLPSGRERTNDAGCPKRLENRELSQSQAALEQSLWCDESEKYIPSDSWLARWDNMDPNYNMYSFQRKRPSVLSLTSEEMSSVDEGSSIDNIPVSYFAPNYPFQKNTYPFKKSTEGSGREKIRSGGFLNEDKEVTGAGEQQGSANEGWKPKSNCGVKIKELSSRSRKPGTLPRSSSRKKLYSLKKKAAKSLSPSEAEDSEEYWVKEPEDEDDEEEEEEEEELREEYCLIQGIAPYGTLASAKYGLYRQDGQQVFWKRPKGAVPVQLISWPVEEKTKISRLANKLKDQDEGEELWGDYDFYLKRPTAQPFEVLEHRRNSQRYSGKLLKDGGGIIADDHWLRSGAKPKFASLLHGGYSPTAKSREPECMPKKKGSHRPPPKRRDTRDDEIEEHWEKPKTTHHHKVLNGTSFREPQLTSSDT